MDRLASTGTEPSQNGNLTVIIPDRFRLTGAKLPKHIADTPVRTQTSKEPDEMSQGIKNLCGRTLTVAQMWEVIHRKDFSRSYPKFIWRVVRAGFKCGTYRSNIQNYKHRGKCTCCNEEAETIKHMLIVCSARRRMMTRDVVKRLWQRKGRPWPRDLDYAMILGCAVSDFEAANGTRLTGVNSMWRILLSELANIICGDAQFPQEQRGVLNRGM